jgi:saccharopine dehydrogenase-like NADP-dependent oxidoreductase
MSIEHILVVGAGQMGAGIAQVALQAGFQVTLADVAEASLAKGKAGIEKGLAKMVEKGKLDAAAKDAALKKFSTTPSILDAKNVDAAIEAVTPADVADAARRWLAPEREVALVTHSAFLFTLLNAVVESDAAAGEGVRAWFETGELRTVDIAFRE